MYNLLRVKPKKEYIMAVNSSEFGFFQNSFEGDGFTMAGARGSSGEYGVNDGKGGAIAGLIALILAGGGIGASVGYDAAGTALDGFIVGSAAVTALGVIIGAKEIANFTIDKYKGAKKALTNWAKGICLTDKAKQADGVEK